MESFAMNGGDGPSSYSQNSSGQALISYLAKDRTVKAIQQNIVIPSGPNSTIRQIFRIADLGCSVGPNTLASIETIIEAIKLRYKAEGVQSEIPEFQVFFNDQDSSDFNTLFRTLPQDRSYLVAGVPGSFHGRLFPRASMNVMHSSYALHWLSKVPEEVQSPESPAWNKGKITYCESSPKVTESFSARFQGDLEDFFNQRSTEMADNGLLVILMPCRSDGTRPTESLLIQFIDCLLGELLSDMAKEGLFDGALIDSFNIPIFIPTAGEVSEVVSKIEFLNVEVMEKMCLTPNLDQLNQQKHPLLLSLNIQAVFEDLLVKHFGPATTQLVFSRLSKKIEQRFLEQPLPACLEDIEKFENLFMLLRKGAVSN